MKNKPIVIVDFSHLSIRNLFTAINQAKPRKKKGLYITEDFIQLYKHQIFHSLQFIKNKFKGDLILALDSTNNWRKDVYSGYKNRRQGSKDDSEVDFDAYFDEVDKILEIIKEAFPYKTIKVPKSEADDIAGVLSNEIGKFKDIILVTSDHDWLQCTTNSKVKMYDPMKKEFRTLSEEEASVVNTPEGEMTFFTAMHILKGDSGDDVPKITEKTEFSDNFISYLKSKEIYSTDVLEFSKTVSKDLQKKLFEEYSIYKTYKSGKNKGKKKDIKDIFKEVQLGDVKAKKMLADTSLITNNPLYLRNFKRNNILVNFDKIPDNIKEQVLKDYSNLSIEYNEKKIFDYFLEEGLGQHITNIERFYDSSYNNQSSLDDFLDF